MIKDERFRRSYRIRIETANELLKIYTIIDLLKEQDYTVKYFFDNNTMEYETVVIPKGCMWVNESD